MSQGACAGAVMWLEAVTESLSVKGSGWGPSRRGRCDTWNGAVWAGLRRKRDLCEADAFDGRIWGGVSQQSASNVLI